jgi:hypothetical protein
LQAKKGNLSKILQRVLRKVFHTSGNRADHGGIKRCVLTRKAVAQKKISRREELIGV